MKEKKPVCSTSKIETSYKDVVVIGNGPSALVLSYILSGKHPFYNNKGHPDFLLQARLQSCSNKSLLTVDPSFLAQGIEGRKCNPMGALYDQMLHPGTDQGVETTPVVNFVKVKSRLDHVCIGKGPVGGVWANLDPDILTLSLSSWMTLPGLDFDHWEFISTRERNRNSCIMNSPIFLNRNISASGRRVKAGQVAMYYQDYVKLNRLSQFMKGGEVTSVTYSTDSQISPNPLWRVEGMDHFGNSFEYISRFVVLATGTSDNPNTLNIPGENLDFVYHDLKSFKEELDRLKDLENNEPVLIIGGGLSSYDAVLAALDNGFNTIHAFRNSATDRQLSESVYPEYYKVQKLMSCEITQPGYTCLAESTPVYFEKDRKIALKLKKGQILKLKISLVAVLIGSKPNLKFFSHHIPNSTLDVNPWTHEINNAPPNLYAIGNVAGDSFVRYSVGGAAAVSGDILNKTGHITNDEKR